MPKLYHLGSPNKALMGTFTNKKWLYDALVECLDHPTLTSYCKLSADLRASDTAYVTDKVTGELYKVREVEGNKMISRKAVSGHSALTPTLTHKTP